MGLINKDLNNQSSHELLMELEEIQKQLDKKRKKKDELLEKTAAKVKKLDEERCSLRSQRELLMGRLTR